METMGWILFLLTEMVSFQVFHQLSAVELFGTKRAYVYIEKRTLQELVLSKTNSILTWKNVLDATISNNEGLHSRDTCVLSTQMNRTIGKKMSLSFLDNLKFQKYFVHKPTQFSQ
jgi:hypothetical protein